MQPKMKAHWLAAIALATLTAVTAVTAQTLADEPAGSTARAARLWRQTNEWRILDEALDLMRIPNESRDRANLDRNAQHLLRMMEQRGLRPRLLEDPDAAPLVYGEWLVPGATTTYVFYAHYDGQPVDPKEWSSPPFEPTVRTGRLDRGGVVVPLNERPAAIDPEWRIYARGAADDKAGIVGLLAAVDALKASGLTPRANIKFVFEGEEETGSAHLERILLTHKALLEADLWVICDGAIHASGRQNVVFGARGVKAFEIVIHGANRDLHSGNFGNWAPNPAMQLAQLLASMKDSEGRVLIEGFNDGAMPLSEMEHRALDALPDNDAETMRSLGLARVDGGGTRLMALHNLPTLNLRGLASGRVGGQIATIIPSTATAAFDMRLVQGITGEQALARVSAHLRRQGFFVTETAPDDAMRLSHPRIAQIIPAPVGYDAVRTPMDAPIAQRLVSAVERARGPLLLIPTIGGSLPLDMIGRALGSPTILVPIGNPDNNQHAKNENLRVGHLWDGIETLAEVLMME
jgi:acetylornithine deacetylase/succinyl-diaminopimelate desuccinylase-like protein